MTIQMAVNNANGNVTDNWDVFADNSWFINPHNNRDWSQYGVTIEAKTVNDVDTLVFSAENPQATDLLLSLLYIDNDNKTVKIHVNNPIRTTSKKVTSEVLEGADGYIILSGNSRCTLIQNLCDRFYELRPKGWTLEVSKLLHDIDSAANAETLIVDHIRDNVSVKVDALSKAEKIVELRDVILAQDPDINKTTLIHRLKDTFGLGTIQAAYAYIKFVESVPEWLQNEVGGTYLDSVDVAIQVYQLCNWAEKELGMPDVQVWDLLIEIAQGHRGKVTRTIIKRFKEAYGPTKESVDVGESYADEVLTDDAGLPEGAEQAEDDQQFKSLKTREDVNANGLRDLNVEALQTLANGLVNDVYESLENWDPVNYPSSSNAKVAKMLDSLLYTMRTEKTLSDIEAEEAEKELARQEKAQLREQAKREKEDAKAAAKVAQLEAERATADAALQAE